MKIKARAESKAEGEKMPDETIQAVQETTKGFCDFCGHDIDDEKGCSNPNCINAEK